MSLLCNFAITLQELGRFDDAAKRFEESLQLERSLGDRRAATVGYLGGLCHERGDLEGAIRRYGQAIQIAREVGWRDWEQVFSGALAVAYATLDRVSDSERLFDDIGAASGTGSSHSTLAAIALHRGHLELASSRASARGGDEEGAVRHRNAARARLTGAPEPRATDTRFAKRVLEAALASLDTEGTSVSAEDERALILGPEALWFRAPMGKRVGLQQRPRARGMLLALARARDEAPGKPVTVASLVHDVWNGERMLASAGARRVYSLLLALRRRGLRDVIVNRDSGYLIDPAIKVVRRDR